MLSGRAGLIWQPTTAQSYYVSWGNSYNPSGELGVYGGTAQTNLNAINQNLDPEKNQNYEVGAQWDVLTGLQLRAAIFRNEKTNARMADATGDDGARRQAPRRRHRVRGDRLDHAELGHLQRHRVHGRRDRQRARRTCRATRRSASPTSRATSGRSTGCGGGWEIGGGVRGQKGTWLTDANHPGLDRFPATSCCDATVAYVQKQYEVRLNVYNLARQDLLHRRLQQLAEPRAARRSRCSAAVTVRYSFI